MRRSSQSLELPADLLGADLVVALNERLREIERQFTVGGNSADWAWPVGDARDPLDALNLRTADRRYARVAHEHGEQASGAPGPVGPVGPPGPPGAPGGGGSGGGLWTIESRTGVSGAVAIATAADRLWLRLDIVGDVTIGVPSGIPIGGEIVVMAVQDGDGNRRVNWAPEWRFEPTASEEVGIGLTAMIVHGVVAAASKVFVISTQNGVIV